MDICLEHYNIQDGIPFLIEIEKYAEAMRESDVDLSRDAISLPGLAKIFLHKYLPEKTFYYIDNPMVYSEIQKAEVGGKSIIFTKKK